MDGGIFFGKIHFLINKDNTFKRIGHKLIRFLKINIGKSNLL